MCRANGMAAQRFQQNGKREGLALRAYGIGDKRAKKAR
jgi:hypothetical protein